MIELSLGSVLHVLVLKKIAKGTSQRVKRTCGARVLIFAFFDRSIDRSIARSLDRSIARSVDRSAVRLVKRDFKSPADPLYENWTESI